MNLIELENLVKSVPDEYLTKEVQQPTGKIPPFLALSEIQRRKDMRQRYEAQQGAVEKPTIAEQIVGGIGSLPQPQVGAPPPPAIPGGMGAPPVAAGAAPMPTPPGQPQGFAAGGLVGYAEGGKVTPRGSEVKRRKPYNVLEAFKAQSPEYYSALKGLASVPLGAYYQANDMLNAIGNYPIEMVESVRKQGIRNTGNIYNKYEYDPRGSSAANAFNPTASKLRAKDDARLAEAKSLPSAPAPDYLRRPDAALPVAAAPAAGIPAPTGRGPATPRPASETLGVQPGGLGNMPATEISPIPTAAPAVAASGVAPAAKGQPGKLVAETAQEQAYLDALEKGFELPEAINYEEFITAAGQEEAAIRAAAKQEALGAALVQLGAGLAAGNMAAGFAEAGQQAQQIMKEGRRDAAAQKALAQELKLKGMEGQRAQAIEQRRLDLDIAKGLADFAGGSRREREDRQFRIMEMQQRAQQAAASLAASQAAYGLNRDKYELDLKVSAIDFREKMAKEAAGPQPTQKQMDDWIMRSGLTPKGQKPPPNPMDAWNSRYRAALPEATALAAKTFGLPPESLYIRSEAVKPISNPPTTGWSIQKVR